MPLRRLRVDPALIPGLVDDRDLDVLDRHGVAIDPHHTGGLARRRTEPTGELGKVVGRVQPFQRFVPIAAPDQVVPLRNEVAQRTSRVAERNAAVHATARLLGDDRQHGPPRRTRIDLFPIMDPLGDRPPRRHESRRRHKPFGISHVQSFKLERSDRARRRCSVARSVDGILAGARPHERAERQPMAFRRSAGAGERPRRAHPWAASIILLVIIASSSPSDSPCSRAARTRA